MIDTSKILQESRKLRSFFAKKSLEFSIPVSPKLLADKEAVLSSLLFWEDKPNRWFTIKLLEFEETDDFDRSEPAFGSYISLTGVDYEIAQIYISVWKPEHYYEALWDLYVKWMHEAISDDAMELLLSPLHTASL
jgi:hypothetical protein